jgi:hypothetical protein
MKSRGIWRQWAIAVATMIVVLGSGCTAGDGGPGRSAQTLGAVRTTPTEEEAQRLWLPANPYMLTTVQQAVLNNAEIYLIRDCMRSNGYPDFWPGISFREEDFNSTENTEIGNPIFNESVATKYGYNLPPEWLNRSDTDADLRNKEVMAPDKAAQFSSCITAERSDFSVEEIFGLSNQVVSGLAGTYPASKEDPAVVEAGKAWVECMRPQGIPDLPESPLGGTMPTPSQRDSWPITLTDVPSEAERTAAIADAKCRESSGITRRQYEAWYRLEAEKLNSDSELADQAVRAQEAFRPVLEKARQIIAEHAGQD